MDLNRKIAFKMPTEEFEEITIDRNNIEPDLVDMDSFWEKIELAVISKAFTRSNLELLNQIFITGLHILVKKQDVPIY